MLMHLCKLTMGSPKSQVQCTVDLYAWQVFIIADHFALPCLATECIHPFYHRYGTVVQKIVDHTYM